MSALTALLSARKSTPFRILRDKVTKALAIPHRLRTPLYLTADDRLAEQLHQRSGVRAGPQRGGFASAQE
jgi:hypothetical protein